MLCYSSWSLQYFVAAPPFLIFFYACTLTYCVPATHIPCIERDRPARLDQRDAIGQAYEGKDINFTCLKFLILSLFFKSKLRDIRRIILKSI